MVAQTASHTNVLLQLKLLKVTCPKTSCSSRGSPRVRIAAEIFERRFLAVEVCMQIIAQAASRAVLLQFSSCAESRFKRRF
jgi:hypothetical protein